MSTLLSFIFVLGVLVFVHEYGHFWVARRNGVRVAAFSIGFGPELYGWTDAHGTRWRVSIIPLGGYVKFFGDQDVSSSGVDKDLERTLTEQEKSEILHYKTPYQRIAVSAAGPLANYLLAFVLLAGLYMFKGIPGDTPAVISHIEPKSVAESAGIQVSDKIVQFGTHPVTNFTTMRHAFKRENGKDVAIKIERSGKIIEVTAKLYSDENGKRSPVKLLGVRPAQPDYHKENPISAIVKSATHCVTFSWDILCAIGRLITGNGGDMGGILSIADGAGQSASGGVAVLISFMAMLSINLGLFNLLPVPLLDGGHIMMYIIEIVRGRPLSEQVQNILFKAGIAFVLGLMIYTTGADLVRYQDKIIAPVKKILHMS